MSRYLFDSARLGFRNWREEDINSMAAINADPAVMEFFPGLQDVFTTRNFIERMQKQYHAKSFTYFAVELLETGDFIGFIGLSYQEYDSPWTPFVDIGWRLDKSYWGRGLATEGAKRSLKFAFEAINIQEVFAVAPTINLPSIRVMEKIGMKKIGEFAHPNLADNPTLAQCVAYKISP